MPCESYVSMGTWPVEDRVMYTLKNTSIDGYKTPEMVEVARLLLLGINPDMPLPENMRNKTIRFRVEMRIRERIKKREIPYGKCLRTGEIVFCHGKNEYEDSLIRKKHEQQLEPLLRKYEQEQRKTNYIEIRTPEGSSVERIPIPFIITPNGIKKTGSNVDIDNLIRALEESIRNDLKRQIPIPEKPTSSHTSLDEIDPSEGKPTNVDLHGLFSTDEKLKDMEDRSNNQ